jgi:hypothetical protein
VPCLVGQLLKHFHDGRGTAEFRIDRQETAWWQLLCFPTKTAAPPGLWPHSWLLHFYGRTLLPFLCFLFCHFALSCSLIGSPSWIQLNHISNM